MKLIHSICAITLALLSSAVQADPTSNVAPTSSNTVAQSQPGSSEAVYHGRIYDIWCDPEGEYCYMTSTTGGRKLARERLRAHIPMADQTTTCSLEFCYNDTNDVIGLNPEYALWTKAK